MASSVLWVPILLFWVNKTLGWLMSTENTFPYFTQIVLNWLFNILIKMTTAILNIMHTTALNQMNIAFYVALVQIKCLWTEISSKQYFFILTGVVYEFESFYRKLINITFPVKWLQHILWFLCSVTRPQGYFMNKITVKEKKIQQFVFPVSLNKTLVLHIALGRRKISVMKMHPILM